MSKAADHRGKAKKMKGVFHRDDKYRKTCKKSCKGGYHGNRWNAHHILPAETFAGLPDFIMRNLQDSTYDINAKYSMAGLPKLTAFILWAQRQKNPDGTPAYPYEEAKETTVTMRRWGTVEKYKNQTNWPVEYPGEFPVHNPVNWGHVKYDKEVAAFLEDELFKKMRQKAAKKPQEHFTPQQVKAIINRARDKFWSQLTTIPKSSPPGAVPGGTIADNLRHRYDTAKDGWWKPMCMVEKAKRPISPSLAQS